MPVRSSEILWRGGRFVLWCWYFSVNWWLSAECHIKCSNFSWARLAFAQVCSHEHCLTADLNNNLIMPGLVWCQCTGFSCFSWTTASLCTEDTNFCPLERISCPFVQLSLPSFSSQRFVTARGFLWSMAPWSKGCCFCFMSALQNTRALLPCCIQAGATAVTVENPPEHGKGLQRSLKGAGHSAFCSSAVLAGWEFVLVLSRDFLTRIWPCACPSCKEGGVFLQHQGVFRSFYPFLPSSSTFFPIPDTSPVIFDKQMTSNNAPLVTL